MISIDFGETRSKVKVTGALNVRIVSARYLENYLLQSLFSSPELAQGELKGLLNVRRPSTLVR
jgi:hypothetical protein